MEKNVIRDEIHTGSVDFAKVLDKALREKFLVPHNGYMWRVTQADWQDHSRIEHYNGLFGGSPSTFRAPGPTTWLFRLERDEP